MDLRKHKGKGFTLLEMMLVMAIISSFMVLFVNYSGHRLDQFRRDKAALQIQQILNAGMAYYVSNGNWPITGTGVPVLGSCPSATITTPGEELTTTQTLMAGNYLPSANEIISPWQTPYYLNCSTTGGTNYLTVTTDTTNVSNAQILQGQLPIAFIPTATNTPGGTWITAQVTIPGQNLNNARSVNFTNVYLNGGCIPVPICPTGTQAEVVVAPVSVSGLYDAASMVTYPITSFSAFVTGPGTSPNDCDTNTTASACYSTGSTAATTANGTKYWRACIAIYTTQGQVTSASAPWGKYVSIMAVTRCSPNYENVGSDMSVFTN